MTRRASGLRRKIKPLKLTESFSSPIRPPPVVATIPTLAVMVWMASYWALIPLINWSSEELMTMSAGRVLGTMRMCDRHPDRAGTMASNAAANCCRFLMGTNLKYNFPVRGGMTLVLGRICSALGHLLTDC